MTVDSRHVSAILRFTNVARERIMSLHRVRPNITGFDLQGLGDALQQVQGELIGGASMTVTSELFNAEA